MWILLLFLGSSSVLSAPLDEFRSLISEGELTFNDDLYLKHIIPSGYSPQKIKEHSSIVLTDFIDKENKNYQLFIDYMNKGYAMKGITFNIYDDNTRETAIALFHMLQEVKKGDMAFVMDWARSNINKHMLEYVLRLLTLYNNNVIEKLLPPFIYKPHYFVNSETIAKALNLKINKGYINRQEAEVYQIYKKHDNILYINTNYSSWNSPADTYDILVNYFREDISLNSHYYGVHLAHPFWMSNEELDQINPRHAEHYHFKHQQLLARYNLEKEHLRNVKTVNRQYDSDFCSFLSYENGLAFPTRSSFLGEPNEYKVALKSIDIALKEFISRRLIIMDNGTLIKMTEDNYISLLAKLIRANLDGIKAAKMIRNLYGYGGYGYPMNQYNPAPSVLHHPETSLRDPVYWFIIEKALNYSREFTYSIKPYDISVYESDKLTIVDNEFSTITTYFDYYQFDINKALQTEDVYSDSSNVVITARQMRLNHLPFTLNFTVESIIKQNVAVRLFLGPLCHYKNCFNDYYKFYELDSYIVKMKEGTNIISWCPENSSKFSFDNYYNLEIMKPKENKYNLFKFPENLAIPKGLEEGLNMTLFIIITTESDLSSKSFHNNIYNNQASLEIDEKPLGFPFHRIATNYFENANNYRFYNISIYHKKRTTNTSGHFSSHLY
ncbi:arylphorin subunit alpha [Aphomia sociella]